jgi:hypothetical protein
MQVVPVTTNVVSLNPAHGEVVSLNPAHGEVYSIQHYVIKLDLRQVIGFLHQ